MEIKLIARFLPLGDTALTVEFGAAIDPETNARVMTAARAIAGVPGVRDIVPTFRSLTVHYDPDTVSHPTLVETLGGLTLDDNVDTAPVRTWRVPVLYDGPDLDAVADHCGLPVIETIALHAETDYRVYMLGFLPGFAYLGDLPEALRLPRLARPRIRVSPGSVAIAERMTAVYPSASPGGWRLIGRTPLRLFDIAQTPPCLFAPGDRVRFEPVSDAAFSDIERAVERAVIGRKVTL